MQIVVDEVIARGDTDLLVVLALGFALLTVIRVATSALRGLILLVVQNVLQFQLGARLFRHLIRLPTSYFEKRHIGDVLSRFTSLQPIRTLLAEGVIAAVLDGIMAVLTLVMIFVYSTQLAFVASLPLQSMPCSGWRSIACLWRRTEATIQGRRPGELNLHRDRAGHSDSQAFQPRGRT
jgi:ATP-binding cassette subfamily B protein RaxB